MQPRFPVPARWWVLALLLLTAGQVPGASAQVLVQQSQDDVPSLLRIEPLAVQRGTSAEVTLRGQRLAGVLDVLCATGSPTSSAVELEEVIAHDAVQPRLRLRIAADAPLGAAPCHVLCEAGLSNPRMLRIDHLPVVREAEPYGQHANDTPSAAQPVAPPTGISGTLSPADVDWYVLEVPQAETAWVFDLECARIGSPLRPTLILADDSGRELRRASVPDPAIAPDVRLEHTFAQPGRYRLGIFDRTYRGGEYATYYLRVAPLRFATAMFPLGGQRATRVRVTLTGGNLPQPVEHEVDLSDAVPGDRLQLQVPHGEEPLAGPVAFAVGRWPEAVEREPNDQPQRATPLTWPCTVNGRIDTPGDRDVYRIRVAAQQKLQLRVMAQQLGSPLDAVLHIEDSSGRRLATADDVPQQDELPPVVRPQTLPATADDPRLEWVAPAEGEYLVVVEDLFGGGSPAHGYRLEIADERPDFQLLVQPGGATSGAAGQGAARQAAQRVVQQFSGEGTGALSIDRGGRGSLVVHAIRRGYNGPIRLEARDLPAGLAADDAVIPEGQTQGVIVFRAEFDPQPAARFVEIVGTAEDPALGEPIRRVAQHAYLAALPPYVPPQFRWPRVAVGIADRGAELAIRARLAGPVVPGATASLHIELRRRPGIDGPVTVRAANAPAGLMVPPCEIEAGQNEAVLPIASSSDIVPGPRTLLLEATLAGQDTKREPITASAQVQLDVRPAVEVELLATQAEIAVGGQTALPLRIRWNAQPASTITLGLAGLPDGVQAAPEQLTLAADAQSAELVLRADETARPSFIRRIVRITARTEFAGQTLELPAQRVALKVVAP